MLTMDDEVVKKLTDEELIERALTMANKNLHIARLRKKKNDDAKSVQMLIDEELDEVARLSRVLVANEEARKQGDLSFGDEIATSVLAEVHRRAGDEGRAGDNGAAGPDGRVEPSDEDQIGILAQAFVDDLKGLLPESVNHTNQLLKGFFSAKGVPTGQRKRIREAVKVLLDAGPVIPAGYEASDAEPEPEPEPAKRARKPAKKAPRGARAHA